MLSRAKICMVTLVMLMMLNSDITKQQTFYGIRTYAQLDLMNMYKTYLKRPVLNCTLAIRRAIQEVKYKATACFGTNGVSKNSHLFSSLVRKLTFVTLNLRIQLIWFSTILAFHSLRLVSQIYRIGEIASLVDISYRHKAFPPDSPLEVVYSLIS